MEIVTCTDDNFIMPMGIMIYSVCANNQESEITFHIVTDKVSSVNRKRLADTVSAFHGKSIVFYDIEMIDTSDIPPLEKNARLTKSTYYRLFLTEVLPSSVKKVIYLDGDIVVRQSIKPLWDFELENKAIAATPESNSMLDSFFERLKYPKEKGYFNAGVLLINLEYWRNNRLLYAFKDFMRNHTDRIVYHDQDILNYTLRDYKEELPIKYNLQCGFLVKERRYPAKYCKEIEDIINNAIPPFIIHFEGQGKPWRLSCRHPYRNTFLKYKSQTIWKNDPLQEDRPLSLRIKKAIGKVLRKYHLIEELPPYGKGFLPNLKPLD